MAKDSLLEFIETESYEKGFSDHYSKNILPLQKSLEDKRLELYGKYKSRVGIAMILGIIIVLGFIALASSANKFDLRIIVLPIIGLYFWVNGPVRKYNLAAKEDIFKNVVNFYEGFKYDPIKQISSSVVKPFGILPHFDTYDGEDYISGKYKNINLAMSEIKLQQRHHTKNGTHYTTVFNGLFILLDSPKKFKGKTLVKKDSGKIGNFFKGMFKGSGLQKISLEDPVFEKLFEVYGTDQVESRYLLTPAFMERVLNLSNHINGNPASKNFFSRAKIQFSFYDNALFLMIPTNRNMFEPGNINQSCIDTQDIKNFLKEMSLIFEIIDILKLDIKTKV